MFRTIFLPLVTCAIASALQQGPDPLNARREQDIYAIYSLTMTNPPTSHGGYTGARYLIAGTTGRGQPEIPWIRPPAEHRANFEQVLEDYARRKAIPRELMPALSLDRPYILLSAGQVGEFINMRSFRRSGPETAAELFQGVSDVFTLSDVYFNQRGTLALTSLSSWCGGLCAMYAWRVFEKEGTGTWEERKWTACFTVAELPAEPLEALLPLRPAH